MPSSKEKPSVKRIQTGSWIFYKDYLNKQKLRDKAGPFVSEWRNKYDTFGKSYRDIQASLPGLPSIPSVKPSRPKWDCTVYTRYTNDQYQRKKDVEKIKQIIHQPIGFYNQAKDQIPAQDRDIFKATLLKMSNTEKEREENLKAHEDMVSILDPTVSNADLSSRGIRTSPTTSTTKDIPHAMNPEELEAMMEYNKKNLYIYHAKPPKLTGKKKIEAQRKQAKAKLEETLWDSPDEVRLRDSVQSHSAPTTKSDKNQYRYGAWYLRPKAWNYTRKDQKLQDPKQIEFVENMTGLEMKKREMAEELSSLYVTKAFSEFVKGKNARIPEFLVLADRIHIENLEKQRQKDEAEERAKQEYLLKTWH